MSAIISSRRYTKKNQGSVTLVLAVLAVLAVAVGGFFTVKGYLTETTSADCVVSNTETVYDVSSKTQSKRVYTENCGVFTVNDDAGRLFFNSADVYGSIKDGETYTFTSTGYRIPILSMFPNIISAK